MKRIKIFRRPNLWLAALESSLTLDSPAHAAPIVGAIVGLVHATGIVASILNTVISVGLAVGVSSLINAVFGPSKQPQQERQASLTTLAIGETPRVAIFGTACVGGTLADGFNWGGTHGTDYECLIITLADHKCEGLTSFYVNDQLITFPAGGFSNGIVPDQGSVQYKGQLQVWFLDGSASQTLPSVVTNGGWPTTGNFNGLSLAIVAYKADDPKSQTPVWAGGRPQFKWVVKGKRCYIARKDSSVGGSGSHRWNNPATWEWTDNAYDCRYNWVRGIYALDQVNDPNMLLIGRGLSEYEAPPVNTFAPANICDEAVPLAAGGTEPRYRVGGAIKSNDTFVSVEKMFADAMAGFIFQPEGSVEIEPGHARGTTFTITDDDLIVGSQVVFSPYRSLADSEWVNTVIPRYTEPSQKWQEHAAPVRRVASEVAGDGGTREATVTLSQVTSGTQAQRVAEQKRRMGRLTRTATITLGPRFCGIEEGDWGVWYSNRHYGGGGITWRVETYHIGIERQITLNLREISSQVCTWNAATDEFASDVSSANQAYPGAGYLANISLNGPYVSDAGNLATLDQVTLGPSGQVYSPIYGYVTEPMVFNRLAPLGSNTLINSDLVLDTVGWEFVGGNALGQSTGITSGRNFIDSEGHTYFGNRNVAYLIFVAASGNLATTTWVYGPSSAGFWAGDIDTLRRFSLPVVPGDRVFMREMVAGYGLASAYLRGRFWDASGHIINDGAYDVGGAISGSKSGLNGDLANFAEISGFATAPTGAAYFNFGLYGYPLGGLPVLSLLSTEPMMAKVAQGQTAVPPYTPGPVDRAADVTLLISGPSGYGFDYSYNGIAKDGQFARSFQYRLNQGSGFDVTSSGVWSASTIRGAATYTIGAATGNLNITGMTQETEIEIKVTYHGVTRTARWIGTQNIDAVPSGGSGGGSSASTSQIPYCNNPYYGSSISPVLNVMVGTSGQVNLTYNGSYQNNGGDYLYTKFQIYNGSSWIDVGYEQINGPPYYVDSDEYGPIWSSGDINSVDAAYSLTPGASYQFRLTQRNGSGTQYSFPSATFSAVAA